MLTMSISIYAQDVIVKKDGTTIMAKVLTVGTTTVEYKKWSNQDGPTYVIEKTELLSINYANGEKEVFSEQQEAETLPGLITQPEIPVRTYSQKDIDQAVSRTTSQIVYKSTAGRGKIIGGSLLFALVGVPGLTSGIIGACADLPGGLWGTSLGVGIFCTSFGIGLISNGMHDKKEALGITQTPILQHQFKIGDYALTPSVNVYSDKLTKQKGLGAGLAFNF